MFSKTKTRGDAHGAVSLIFEAQKQTIFFLFISFSRKNTTPMILVIFWTCGPVYYYRVDDDCYSTVPTVAALGSRHQRFAPNSSIFHFL